MKIEEVKEYILGFLNKKLNPKLCYHNIDHTIDVYNNALILAKKEKLVYEEQCLLLTATLFHDAGMLKSYDKHEDASIEIAKLTLPDFDYSKEEIREICKIISVTKPDVIPESKCEGILKDADLDYLGRKDYFIIAQKLRHEWDIMDINSLSLKEWYQFQIDFLKNHKFYTKSAIELREDQKLRNLKEIEEMFL